MALKVALAQIDPTVGDFVGNARLILEASHSAQAAGADLVAFGEMALTGYPVEDLALRADFQKASVGALAQLASELSSQGLGELTVVVGYLGQPLSRNIALGTNSAAVVHGGRVVASYHKHHLPTYGVFDEHRYFEPGQETCVFEVSGSRVALVICEDIWQDGGTLDQLKNGAHEIDLLMVINGSPFETGKWQTRVELSATHARELGCPVAYVNLVGGQDELVFDGTSFVVDQGGALSAVAPAFEPALLTWEFTPGLNPIASIHSSERIVAESELSQIYRALVVATRDYVEKNSFATVVLGLSGGIDSALTAAVACDALGANKVFGVALPGPYSSQHSLTDAEELAKRTGLDLRVISIDGVVEAFAAAITGSRGQSLVTGVVEENLQARVRGTTLMAISNAEGHLVLATGNKSELATGYSTLYGDAVGAFAPLKDVPKTKVWALARWRNTASAKEDVAELMHSWGAKHQIVDQPIPENSIEKDPSAELRPNQKDTDSLPDYPTLDSILEAYIEGADESPEATALSVISPSSNLVAHVIGLVDRAEFKRRQYPPGPKIGSHAFGRDRRLPITSRYRP